MVDLKDLALTEAQQEIYTKYETHKIHTQLKSFLDEDIAFKNLGSDNDFERAEESKNSLCNYFRGLLSSIMEHAERIDPYAVEEILRVMKKGIQTLDGHRAEIVHRAEAGVHDPHYLNQRDNLITQFEQLEASVRKTLLPLLPSLNIAALETLLENTGVREAKGEYEAARKIAEERTKEIGNILENLRSDIGEESIATGESGFGKLASDYKENEWNWFFGFVVFSIFLIIAIFYATNASLPEKISVQETAYILFERILYISTAAVFMRVCLSKYNKERHLRVLYSHRKSVLGQYLIFENSIPEDEYEAKHSLRMEMARVLFSDPATGYSVSEGKNELNINPVMSAAERIMTKG